jgi:hypothetical protein
MVILRMDRGATFYLYKVPASRVQKFNELKLCPQPVADFWLIYLLYSSLTFNQSKHP